MKFEGEEFQYLTVAPTNATMFGDHKVFFQVKSAPIKSVVNPSATIKELQKFLIEAYSDHILDKRTTLKVFISQPYTGYTEEEIFERRNKIAKGLSEKYPFPIYIIDQYHREVPDHPYKDARLYNLGQSISMMEDADVIYFVSDYDKSAGCIAEHTVAQLYKELYNWHIVYEDENDKEDK